MGRLSARVSADRMASAFSDYYRFAQQRLENAALIATDRAAKGLKTKIREDMSSAGLGRLGNAWGVKTDRDRGGIQRRYPNGGFSASGTVFVRSKSDRTVGALLAYTRGADIRPVRSRWLWFPTDQVPRLGKGRTRLTPGTWESSGMVQRIGPLVYVRSINGNPLLVVKSASVALSGKSRSAKSLTKRGKLRKGQAAKEFIVAFIGIPRTARAARVDVNALARAAQAELPELIREAIGRI